MVVVTLSDSVSSADGIRTQRPLEQRSNARGASTGRSDRPSRGRGHTHSARSNDRLKPSPCLQQPDSAPSPVSNDVSVQSSFAAVPSTVSTSKEAGDSGKSAAEKTQVQSQSTSSTEPSVNNSETAEASVTPSAGAVTLAGDWCWRHCRYVIASNLSKVILQFRSRLFIVFKIVISISNL